MIKRYVRAIEYITFRIETVCYWQSELSTRLGEGPPPDLELVWRMRSSAVTCYASPMHARVFRLWGAVVPWAYAPIRGMSATLYRLRLS